MRESSTREQTTSFVAVMTMLVLSLKTIYESKHLLIIINIVVRVG